MADLPSATSAADEKTLAKKQVGASRAPYCIEREFDLDDLLAAKIANGDVVNLLNIPANHMIIAATIESTVVQVGGTGTCTLQLKVVGTTLTPAANISALEHKSSTTIAPVTVGTSAGYIEAVAAIGGGTVTTNPTIKIRILGIDMS
jgi:hypothetical protein